jgi:hypothetical protein
VGAGAGPPCPWDERTCESAAQGGHLEVLTWARMHGCPWRTEVMCRAAAAGGNLAVLQWVREMGCPWGGSAACAAAARYGHLEVLKCAWAQGCPRTTSRDPYDTCRNALAFGDEDMQRWMREEDLWSKVRREFR